MPQKSVQTQVTTQTQQQNALQLMLSRVLELPIADFCERVRNELLDNEALEEADILSKQEETEENAALDMQESMTEDTDTTDLGMALGDYLTDDDMPDYLRQRIEANREGRESVVVAENSFYDDLFRQMGEQNLNEQEKILLEYLIGSLDADGYLRKDLATISDELAVFQNIYTDEEELARMLRVLQTFEPSGIGARDLQECLQLQLSDPDHHGPWRHMALQVVKNCFKDFTRKRWERIAEHFGWDDETMQHVIHELTHLNPTPGRAGSDIDGHAAPTVIPDFIVRADEDGHIEVILNEHDLPEIRVSRAFRDMLAEYAPNKSELRREQQEAYIYARKKVDDAQTFIHLLHRRKETLLAIMQSIVAKQCDFFIDDDNERLLQPLTLKDVATQAGVDISTVSRAVNSKYVQTAYGVYALKYFFSGTFKGENGTDIATRKVKIALEDLVAHEDKQAPYSDDALTTKLNEIGFPVARRTVAKYREQLGIPVARLRKI